MNTIHHKHTLIIGALPLLLLIFAAQWGNLSMQPLVEKFTILAERSEQKLILLDTELRGVQKAYALLTDEENISYRSPVAEHQSKSFGSVAEKYWDSLQSTRIVRQRVSAMRTKMNNIGRKAVHIDLSEQIISVIENGEIIREYPISSGKWATPTPTGTFQIHRKQTLRVSSQEIPYRMPYYMAFTPNGAYGMHALPYLGQGPESSDYWQEALDHIGTPASHGCVRLLPADAEALYSWIDVGTPLYIDS